MSGIPYVADHVTRALSRLPVMFSRTGKLAGLVNAQAARIQTLEDQAYAIIAASSVETATGGQLDVLGKLVKQPRGGLDDDSYRLYIQARIKLNRGITPGPRFVDTAQLLQPTSPGILFTNYPPAGIRMLILGPTAHGYESALLLKSGVAGGVNGEVLWEVGAPSVTFTLDSGPGLDVGHLAGSV